MVCRCSTDQMAELVRAVGCSIVEERPDTMAPCVIIGGRAREILRADHML